MRHFYEKLREQHGVALSYAWVKLALQGAGLEGYGRPLPGMLLHLDGSSHAWVGDGGRYDLLVLLDV